MSRFPVLALLLLLAACGSSSGPDRVGGYVGGTVPLECAPFARALSGVKLYGPAGDWWWKAQGKYARAYTPAVGSVLVFAKTARLRDGHAAVVSKVISSRQILVTQANWVHHRVTEDQPAIDISRAGDWSEVRVWWPPSGQMGTTEYPTLGFIASNRPASHEMLAARTPGAIQIALNGD
ncbi:MAG: CHAP domain-containing protein [Rhodospirillales bacterium]